MTIRVGRDRNSRGAPRLFTPCEKLTEADRGINVVLSAGGHSIEVVGKNSVSRRSHCRSNATISRLSLLQCEVTIPISSFLPKIPSNHLSIHIVQIQLHHHFIVDAIINTKESCFDNDII